MDFGFFTIDFGWLPDLTVMTPLDVMWWFFVSGGWVVFVIIFLWILKIVWLNWRQNKFASKLEFVMLAIDVPRENMQSPKAVEHIFNQLWGIMASPSPKQKWISGEFPLAFSLEIVSIEGFIQYVIRTPKQFKDVIEAAFYAQYPDAEITEIRDYTEDFGLDFRQKGYNLWGSEIVLANDQFYPIKTYPYFEHTLTQQYADPLAAILELFGKLGPSEQIWFQIIIQPAGDGSWKEGADKLVNKLIGIKEESKKTTLDKIIESPLVVLEKAGDVVFNRPASGPAGDSSGVQTGFLALPPHVQEAVKAIGMKASKTGFKSKMRVVYIAQKEALAKAKVVPSFFGALKQFAALNLNGFRPGSGTLTSAAGWFEFRNKQLIRQRQDKILTNYKSRSLWAGRGSGFILNTEELASLYHFPGIELRASSVQKVTSKKSEAPSFLPVQGESPFERLRKVAQVKSVEQEKKTEELEFVGDENETEGVITIEEDDAVIGEDIDLSEPEIIPRRSSSRLKKVDDYTQPVPVFGSRSTKAGPPTNLPVV